MNLVVRICATIPNLQARVTREQLAEELVALILAALRGDRLNPEVQNRGNCIVKLCYEPFGIDCISAAGFLESGELNLEAIDSSG